MASEKGTDSALPEIKKDEVAFSHVPEHGFSLFLAKRQKTIHFIRHAEGYHNEANHAYGDDTPCTFSTPDSWQYQDARLTDKGIGQCVKARETLLGDVNPELVVVSPFTRTLQTAHIMFGGKGYPFIVHNLCRERSGKFTCDKMRSKTEIVEDIKPIYDHSYDRIDFDSFGFLAEEDQFWTEGREPSDVVIGRGVDMMKWLATRPESEIAVVTHSSWLKHLFRSFGETIVSKDKDELHRLSGNAEVRSVCLAMHKGFYPDGEWVGDTDVFIPSHPSFRKGRWSVQPNTLASMHKKIQPESKK
uniref:Phosphoglycerate mutase-like protein n=2 Tax=Ditylum brightwellii TaxID=49249 RepID=A0A6S8ZUH4_9STRA|mmetsp:Transcript_7944/g.10630  ORF Transcript_7944/g.10630 Transcript_7944/m.10630 type:complete len:302 (-) Transcript_7944:303-1208(-)